MGCLEHLHSVCVDTLKNAADNVAVMGVITYACQQLERPLDPLQTN